MQLRALGGVWGSLQVQPKRIPCAICGPAHFKYPLFILILLDALNEHNSIADELGALLLLLTSRASERITAACKSTTAVALMERCGGSSVDSDDSGVSPFYSF